MNNKLVRILLFASIVLNIAFISYHIIKKNNPAFFKKKSAYQEQLLNDKRLNLTEDQVTQIKDIFNNFKVILISSKQEMLDKRMGIIEELSTPEPNLGFIWNNVNQLNLLESSLNRDFVEALIKVSNILGSGQNIKFLLKLSQRWLYFGKGIKGVKK